MLLTIFLNESESGMVLWVHGLMIAPLTWFLTVSLFFCPTEAAFLYPWLPLCCQTTQRLQGHPNKSDQATNQRVKAPVGSSEIRPQTTSAPTYPPLPKNQKLCHHAETIHLRPRRAQQSPRRDPLHRSHRHRPVEGRARKAGPLGPLRLWNGRKRTLSPVWVAPLGPSPTVLRAELQNPPSWRQNRQPQPKLGVAPWRTPPLLPLHLPPPPPVPTAPPHRVPGSNRAKTRTRHDALVQPLAPPLAAALGTRSKLRLLDLPNLSGQPALTPKSICQSPNCPCPGPLKLKPPNLGRLDYRLNLQVSYTVCLDNPLFPVLSPCFSL